MTITENPFMTSPSLVHQRLMSEMTQSMSYNGGDFAAWQKTLRTQLIDLLGYDEQPSRVDLNVRSLWKREHEYGSIEKIVFTAEESADVPAYLCLPRDVTPPYLPFICLQGHSTGMHNSIAVDLEDESRAITIEGDRDFGIGCMKRGIAALCIEQRGFGERRENRITSDGGQSCHHAAMAALHLGRTLLGERIFDVDRGIDYLASRGDMDTDRLGVMGNSGGGTVSLFSAAVLPRVKASMPSCYFCTFEASIQSIHHCVCNYVPGLMKYAEMGDIAGLIAPKPLIIVSGEDDPIFPIRASLAEFTRVEKMYAAAGASNNVRHVVGRGGHRFYADDAWKAYFEVT